MPQMPAQPTQPSANPAEMRICFTWLNRGQCERGAVCKFRHLAPDHPDAIADRIRSGKLPPSAALQAGSGGAGGPPPGMVPGGGWPGGMPGGYAHDANASW